MSYERLYMSWAFVELCQISPNARPCRPVWTAPPKQDCLVSIYCKFSRLPSGKQWHIFSHSHPHFNHLSLALKNLRDTISAYRESFHNTAYGHYHYSHPFLRRSCWERAKTISQKHTKTTGDNVEQKKKSTQVLTKTAQWYCKESVLHWAAPEECPLVVEMITSPASHPDFFQWSLYLHQDSPLGCTCCCTPVEARAPHDDQNVSPHQLVCCPTWRK